MKQNTTEDVVGQSSSPRDIKEEERKEQRTGDKIHLSCAYSQ
jgi:hypothetical protein